MTQKKSFGEPSRTARLDRRGRGKDSICRTDVRTEARLLYAQTFGATARAPRKTSSDPAPRRASFLREGLRRRFDTRHQQIERRFAGGVVSLHQKQTRTSVPDSNPHLQNHSCTTGK